MNKFDMITSVLRVWVRPPSKGWRPQRASYFLVRTPYLFPQTHTVWPGATKFGMITQVGRGVF